MSMQELTDAITKAEKVTQKVPEELRPGAFQTVLRELLQRGRSSDMVAAAARRSSRKTSFPTTGTGTTARLLALADGGRFCGTTVPKRHKAVPSTRGGFTMPSRSSERP